MANVSPLGRAVGELTLGKCDFSIGFVHLCYLPTKPDGDLVPTPVGRSRESRRLLSIVTLRELNLPQHLHGQETAMVEYDTADTFRPSVSSHLSPSKLINIDLTAIGISRH